MGTGFAPISHSNTVTIPISDTKPAAGLGIEGVVPSALVLPVALTSSAVTFEVSMDGSTYVPLVKDDGIAYSVAVAASKGVALDLTKMAAGWNYIKLVMGTAEAAERAITLVTRPV